MSPKKLIGEINRVCRKNFSSVRDVWVRASLRMRGETPIPSSKLIVLVAGIEDIRHF